MSVRSNVLQAQVGPWTFLPEHGGEGVPFRRIFGYVPGIIEQMQEEAPFKPLSFDAPVEQLPLPGSRWIATSLTFSIQALVETQAIYEGPISVLQAYPQELKELEEALLHVGLAYTFGKKAYEAAVGVEKERIGLEAEEVQQRKAQITRQLEELKSRKASRLIEGAMSLLRESVPSTGGLILSISVVLPNGRAVMVSARPSIAKLIEGSEKRIISGESALEETVSGFNAGEANGQILLEWVETTQLIVPVYITDVGQPRVNISLNSNRALRKRVAARHGGGEQYAEGVYAYKTEVGVREMFFNYEIEKE